MSMKNAEILKAVEHRQYPMPDDPWIMQQIWHELMFAHWPLSSEQLRPFIPSILDIDTYEREAWIGVVPFRMSNVRPRGIPSIPRLSKFPELNVRTYVSYKGRPGVYFFSLDAGNPIAVAIARTAFHLPYFNAQMECQRTGNTIYYTSHRTHKGAPTADFSASYRSTSQVIYAEKQSIEAWLTERYCLYTTVGAQVYRAEIHHRPWPLQVGEMDITHNTMALAYNIHLPDIAPLLHYAERQKVLVWPIHRLSDV
jgi:uncharacterized protein YqjF (DUF2071 family)